MSKRLDLSCDFEPDEILSIDLIPDRKIVVISVGSEDQVISHYLTYKNAKKLKDWLTENVPGK